MIEVFVPGRPAPQGSKRYLGNGVMVESSKALHPWRADVRARLLDDDGQPLERFTGAVSVRLGFVMPRPASTPKKRTPPAIKRPDIDKLVRAVLDAVKGVLWVDDGQVISAPACKLWGAPARCELSLWRLRPGDDSCIGGGAEVASSPQDALFAAEAVTVGNAMR